MKWKNLLFAFVALAALSTWIYFYEVKGEKKREESAEKEKKVFSFEEKDISQISVKNADGEIVLQKEKDNWNLTKPIQAKADKSTADNLASDFASAKADRSV